ncbi:MAG TPA: efflux RND transporter permease subunit [Gemmataceae bacterium]|nr:efflux RND transporter permease subunit [Gemmataceae bacterium]
MRERLRRPLPYYRGLYPRGVCAIISNFFIDRPIFATVLSVVITLIGGLALLTLPVAQYPHITPPGVSISITYPGANAQVVADTVAAPIEQQVNGVPGMIYMSSQCGNDGSYTLTVTFDIGTDVKTALVMVQNRVTLAMPLLPVEVQNQGITIRKRTPDLLMIVNLFSPDGRYDDIYLSNYATIYLKDELLRVWGVSDIVYQGQRDYSIRAWMDADKMAALNLTATEVAQAIRNQNLDAPSGQTGRPPAPDGQAFQLPITTIGRLTTIEQFGDIIIKVGQSRPSSERSHVSAPKFFGGGNAAGMAGGSASQSTIRRTSGGTPTTGTATSPPNPTLTDAITQVAIASGSSLSTAPLAGGGTSGGGATTGDMTSGAGSSGGATTGGGAMSGSSLSSGGTIPGLSINSSGSGISAVGSAGVLSGETMGRGPGRPDAAIVRLRDIARMELGAQNYNQACLFDGKPSVGLGLYQLPGTNALDVADNVRKKMEELKTRFPDGVDYAIGYDTTPYIRESIRGVFHTLLEAVVLVGLVVLVFLQDWRAMILPMIDVPVSIIGTFAVMALLDFSLNNISLFGLVLAIGIVVDDAIVVLENIERMIARGYDPRTATIKAMEEVTGPIVAVGLVLCAVFVPCAFLSGITGQFFRQFALTISVSTVISAINAITMTPSRAVFLFKSEEQAGSVSDGHSVANASGSSVTHHREALPWWIFGVAGGVAAAWLGPDLLQGRLDLYPLLNGGTAILPDEAPRWLTWTVTALYFTPGAVAGGLFGWLVIRPVNAVLGWLFRGFNRLFDGITAIYGWTVGRMLRLSAVVLLAYGGLVALTYWEFHQAPTGFFPQQDQGRLIVNVQMPDSTSLQRTKEVLAEVARVAHETPGVDHSVAIAGLSFLLQANSSDLASMFIILKPFDERRSPELRDTAIMARLRREWARQIPDAQVSVYGGSPIPGLGVAGGFKLMIEDCGDLGVVPLQEQTDALVRKLKEHPALTAISTQIRSKTPQLFLDIDRAKVSSLGISLNDVNQTLDLFMGSLYVNSFNAFGRHWQVTIQADGPYRNQTGALNRFKVRNKSGEMVPLGTLVNVREIGGPIAITRYNLYDSSNIRGMVRTGYSDGEAIKEIDSIARESLPISMRPDWTELMFLQKRVGNSATYIFLLSVVCVFLALSALYENWALPLAVILVVPLCLLCSVAGVLWTNRDVNIFVQIGLVVLVGLACKNAILVVEYARQLHQEGSSIFEATLTASRLRLRPILMTSFAFILGVLPLALAVGAGAEMRRSLGTAVFSGMLGVTLFGIFLTPVFFYVIQRMGEAPLFRRAAVQWVGSSVVGGLLGAVSGLLLGMLEVFLLPWSVLVGGCAGVVLVLGVLALHQKIKPKLSTSHILVNPVRRLSRRRQTSVPDGGDSP